MTTSADPGPARPTGRRIVGLPEGTPLEETGCLFCSGQPTALVFDDPPFSVRRCAGCGLVFVSPRVDAEHIDSVYGAQYWESPAAKDYGYTDYRRDAGHWMKTYRRRMALIAPLLPIRARILDVGCAAGYFLEVAVQAGHDVHGIELSAPIAEEARHRIGAGRIHVGTLSDAPFENASFDLVTFWDVIEHIPDPAAALRAASDLLRPGGHLLVETQNVESRFARLMGSRWQHFKQAEHLYHFSPSTVRLLFEQAGLAVDGITARRTGKYVGLSFVAERAGKVHPALSRLLSPVARVHSVAPYVNLFDEMAVIGHPYP